jgi:hypothetical protein
MSDACLPIVIVSSLTTASYVAFAPAPSAEIAMILEAEAALGICANGQILQDIEKDDGGSGTYMPRCVPYLLYLPKCWSRRLKKVKKVKPWLRQIIRNKYTHCIWYLVE